MMSVGSLFSGIGGLELGLERTGGFKTAWQCEIDPFCLKVLAKHWSDVKRFTDVKKMGIEEEIPYVDLICGGFPCQPVSCAGKRKGDRDERWLWPEFYRVVCEVRPKWVVIENVPGLLSIDSGRLFAGILRDLSEGGYDAEWNIVSAAFVGAPHLRKRVFVVANTRFSGRQQNAGSSYGYEGTDEGRPSEENNKPERNGESDRARALAHTQCSGRAGLFRAGWGAKSENGGEIPDTQGKRLEGGIAIRHQISPERMRLFSAGQSEQAGADQWAIEPDVGRVANGIPSRVDRLRSLGNAVVPQVSEYVGRCILEVIR